MHLVFSEEQNELCTSASDKGKDLSGGGWDEHETTCMLLLQIFLQIFLKGPLYTQTWS